jgi:large subunit ribosomal protein L9
MKNVEVLLKEDVRHLGRVGDVVKVASGYARNYLYPRGLVLPATEQNVRAFARRRARIEAEEAERRSEFEGAASALEGVRVHTVEKADDGGRLYGSVNTSRVVELLAAAGHTVEEDQVRLDQPIKAIGTHRLEVHVFADLTAEVIVEVEPEDAPQAAAAPGAEEAPAEAPAEDAAQTAS